MRWRAHAKEVLLAHHSGVLVDGGQAFGPAADQDDRPTFVAELPRNGLADAWPGTNDHDRFRHWLILAPDGQASTSASSIRLPKGSQKKARRWLMAGSTNGSVTIFTPRARSFLTVSSTLDTFRQKW
jgi:hypothetical protein